jgi:cytohesin
MRYDAPCKKMKREKMLAIAAAEGDLGKVTAMLSESPHLAKDWQPLMDACFMGQIEAVALLLDQGADPNIVGKSLFKYRPLHRTIERKVTVPRTERHVKVVQLLLERGADPSLRATQSQVSALAMAAMAGESRFLDLLIPYVPNPDIFHSAVLGDSARVQSLLEGDPNLASQQDDNGWSALDYACRSRVGDGNPALEEELRDIVRQLVAAGADVSRALDNVVYRNDVALTDLFLKSGAKIQDGDTLNHAACEGKHEALALVVRAGTDLNETCGTEHHGGYTPFGCTLTMRSLVGARWFLDQGVDPNYVGGPAGESSLHVAVRSRAGVPLLKLLVDAGADPKAKDQAGVTPLDTAKERGDEKAIQFLSSL